MEKNEDRKIALCTYLGVAIWCHGLILGVTPRGQINTASRHIKAATLAALWPVVVFVGIAEDLKNDIKSNS